MKVLVAYDGTLHAKTALRYGLEKVKDNTGELLVIHVFNSDLFFDYDAIPRASAIARRESDWYVKELGMFLSEKANGIKSSIILGEGNPENEIIQCAKDENVDLLLCPTRYKSVANTFRKMLKVRGLETSIYAYGSSQMVKAPAQQ